MLFETPGTTRRRLRDGSATVRDIAGGQDGSGGSGTWAGGNLGTGGDAGAPRATNGCKLVSENLTVSKILRRPRIVAPCYLAIFQTGADIACLCAA
jgi:hypothetical protein